MKMESYFLSGLFFSGTGNTKYCIQKFLHEVDPKAPCVSIEDNKAIEIIKKSDCIVLAYPIYYSNLPKIMHDFLELNGSLFVGKRIFIIATMGLFSGDGAGCSARLLKKHNAHIMGGLHVKMPDCIGDEKALKKTRGQNKQLVKRADLKLEDAARKFINKIPPKEGIGLLYHMAGLFGQRLWFYNKTKRYSDKLRINSYKCVGCGLCVQLCPLDNLKLENGVAKADSKCTMCYRCISSCPKQAITLLGKEVYEQCKIEKYL